MANGKDLSSEQNISEVLAMLKQSVDADGAKSDAFDEVSPTNADSMSEEDLKQMLRMQYMAAESDDSEAEDDTYEIDEAFLEEAVEETVEDPEEEPEDEPEKETEEEPEEELVEELVEEPEEEIEEEIEEEETSEEDDELPWYDDETEEEPEEEHEEALEEEPEEESEEESEEELEETDDGELPWYEDEPEKELDDEPLTVEDINAVEEEFGFLDPALLKLRDEPISDDVKVIPLVHEKPESDSPVPEDAAAEPTVPEAPELISLDDIVADIPEDSHSYFYSDEEEDEDEIDDDLTFDDLVTDEGEDDGVIYESLSLDGEDDDLTFDDLVTDESEDDGVVYESLSLDGEDDDLTFDDLVTDESEDDGVVYESLSLDENEDDGDIAFVQLPQNDGSDEEVEDILSAPASIDPIENIENNEPQEASGNSEPFEDSAESFLGDYFASDTSDILSVSETELDVEAIRARLEAAEEEQEGVGEEFLNEEIAPEEQQPVAETPEGLEEEPSEEFGEFEGEDEFGSFGDGDELGAYYSEDKKDEYQISGADISLLLQFGCDEEVLSIASDEDIESISNADALERISKSVPDDDDAEEIDEALDSKEALESKILSIYNNYSKTRGGVLVRLIAAAALSFLLLLYDGLPLIGVNLPGIMDRDAYFVSHVLIGMQLLIICAMTSGKKLWEGLRKLFTRGSDAYSTVAVLLISVLIYDVVIMTAQLDRPPVFHFVAAIAVIMAIASECAELSATMSTYKFFFSDMLARAGGEVIAGSANDGARYTLHRSVGKDSVADKMYRGGLDPFQKVYSPLEIESAAGYFNVASKKSKRSHAPMAVIVPSMVFSIIMGVLAFAVTGENGELWMSFGIAILSLTFTLPILAIISSWLPFALINRKAMKSGYAFAGEYSAEQYAGCNVFVFKDMHLLEKCAPGRVNLATYDATSSEVLLGCLDALYSRIGGPLSETFSMGDSSKSLGECQLRRIAKSGVEATVGTNYSVLVGNEQFMSRYGISFPQVSFKNKGDEIFSLCVSINGRASARIVVRYSVNEMFEMLAERLAEDGIYCAVETFDPMVSAELLGRIRGEDSAPVSVVHLGVEDLNARSTHKESALFDALGEDTGVLAKRSRLNLVVAASDAVRTVALRKRVNLYCYLAAALGTLLSLAGVFFGWASGINEFIILLYWIATAGGLVALTVTGLPKSDRFSIERFRYEKGRYDEPAESSGKAPENDEKQ